MNNQQLYSLLLSALQDVRCHVYHCINDGCYVVSDVGIVYSDLLYRCVDIARAHGLMCYATTHDKDAVKIVIYQL